MSIPRLSQATLAEMVGPTRSRVSFFMNRFRKLGFIKYCSGAESASMANPHTTPHRDTCEDICRATFSTALSLLCRFAHKPRPDRQFHRVAASPGPFAITLATASPASLRPVFQNGAWSDATDPNRGADRWF